MRVLNLEDNVYKHNDICKVLNNGEFGEVNIECARNLEEGLEKIEEQNSKEASYDLIITDMWYPQKAHEEDTNSGEILINKAIDRGWNIPIILCSSVRYRIPGILGSVHYSKNEDWENELVTLIKKLR